MAKDPKYELRKWLDKTLRVAIKGESGQIRLSDDPDAEPAEVDVEGDYLVLYEPNTEGHLAKIRLVPEDI